MQNYGIQPQRPQKAPARQQAAQGQTPAVQVQRRANVPAVDVFENADEYLLLCDMPGAKKDELRITFQNDTLSLECPRKEAVEGVKLLRETQADSFARSFLVPKGIDADKIAAELKDGVLRIHLPKSAALKPRQIEVKAG